MRDCETGKHDYDNPIRKSRAYWVCPKCGKDISLEVVLIYEARQNEQQKRD